MSSPTFFSKESLTPIRTKDEITIGITNIPLTYPGKLFFIHELKDKEKIDTTYTVLNSHNIMFERNDLGQDRCFIKTIYKVHPKVIRQICSKFRTLHPKIDSDYRYLFWEIDTKEDSILQQVLKIYDFLNLPVYIHETVMGYHFLSVKPILKEKFAWAIRELRHTNEKYPPFTLRIKPNKYVGEENIFFNGWIIAKAFHSDTSRLKDMIERQDFNKIRQYYQIVWYRFESKQEVVIQ